MPGFTLRFALAMAAVAAAAGGCATSSTTPTGTEGALADGRETIHVEVAVQEPAPLFSLRDRAFGLLPGTHCTLTNDRGNWEITTPADVSVERSSSPLRLHCRREGYPPVSMELACVTQRSETMKAGAYAFLRMMAMMPPAAPVAAGVGLGAYALYLVAGTAAGAAAGSALAGGPEADICRYSLTGSIQLVMVGPVPAQPGPVAPAPAGPQGGETDPGPSNPLSLLDVVAGGRGTLVYSRTPPGGKVSLHRVALRPSEGVLIALPEGYTLDVERRMATLAGVRYSPPVPLVSGNLSPGTRWSHSGSLAEIHGVGRTSMSSTFEVVGHAPLATAAGTFAAIHVTERRWQGGTAYRIERWIDPLALVPLKEEWKPDGPRAANIHGTGSFSMFDPPFPEGTIEIRFVAGPG